MSRSSKKQSNSAPQSALTKQKLLDFLVTTAEVERKLEIVKEMLAQQEDYTPASLFHRLDSTRKGYIQETDIQRFLIDQKNQLKGSELKMLFGRINEDKKMQKVQLREFQNFILPNQNPKLRYFTVRRPVIILPPEQPLSQKVQWIATKLFNEIVKQYSNLMNYHQQLLSSFDFNAAQVFKQLSGNGESITVQDIQNFMQQCNYDISAQQIGCLVRVMDKHGQGQVQIDDFKVFAATLGLKKQHEIFDQLSPVPALKEPGKAIKDRDQTLKDRYDDNKSYVKQYAQNAFNYAGHLSGSKSPNLIPNLLASSRRSKR